MRSAHVAFKDATPTVYIHNSRGDRAMCMCVQLNMCGGVFHGSIGDSMLRCVASMI